VLSTLAVTSASPSGMNSAALTFAAWPPRSTTFIFARKFQIECLVLAARDRGDAIDMLSVNSATTRDPATSHSAALPS
jgi:hypothetical protein